MNYYNEIKNELINNEVYKKVKDYSKNRNDLKTYYNVGKLLVEAGKHYGEGIIKKYSERLTKELQKAYGTRNLYNMRLFYLKIHNNEILHTACANLTWSHIRDLLNYDDEKIYYYLKISDEQNLSVRELRQRIKNNEYERLDDKTKLKLINHKEEKIEDFIKNPILIKNKYNKEKITEKMLQQLILEDMPSFLEELGTGFCFIKNEFKIKIGDRYNYIDLLLYNITYKCYAVVELKVTEFKAEYVGQITKYMNYIDNNIKTINEDATIGIIICKKNNKYVMELVTKENVFDIEYQLV